MTLSKVLLKSQFTGNFLTIKRHAGFFIINEEVRQALFDKKPVVALESAIITHGMKYPHNINTAKVVEDEIRAQNAIPATIGVLQGKVKVGLTDAEIQNLGENKEGCVKISRGDLPFILSHKLSGGTTVSSTMIIANKIGIPVFVTGGIGGVHRDFENTMDISADLTELGRTSIAVISSGIKSILDIEKSLEFLETQGVAVVTYGASKELPGFYSRTTGIKIPYNTTTPEHAAQIIKGMFDIKHGSGILIAVPIPENYAIDGNLMEAIIKEALKAAKERNIKGKDVSPFILNYISEITEEKTLMSNAALIKNNAKVGGKIAFELAKLKIKHEKSFEESIFDLSPVVVEERPKDEKKEKERKKKKSIVVIGGSVLDLVVQVLPVSFKPKAVFFTCIDSRMIPTRFTETCVGDMFVVRNAGNVIPNSGYYSDEVTTNEPAALELGCVINDVRHIIVCGHSDCKAMNLLYSLRHEEFSSQTSRRMSPLRAWMCAHASSSLQRFLDMEKVGKDKPLVFHAETPLNKFVAYIDPDNKFRTEDQLSQVNTLQQLQNIASYGFLRNRLERHDLHIHALWFDIYSGDIYYFSRCAKQFVEVNEENITTLLREVNMYYS